MTFAARNHVRFLSVNHPPSPTARVLRKARGRQNALVLRTALLYGRGLSRNKQAAYGRQA